MTHQGRCEDSPERRHSADRRELLRQIGAASTILALSPFAATGMMAQNPSSDLPKTIEEAGERLRNRSVSVTELTKAYLNGAKQFGPKLNPFITLTEEEALKTAAVLDAELGRDKPRGPLHGIPIVYKDNIDTAGTRTTQRPPSLNQLGRTKGLARSTAGPWGLLRERPKARSFASLPRLRATLTMGMSCASCLLLHQARRRM